MSQSYRNLLSFWRHCTSDGRGNASRPIAHRELIAALVIQNGDVYEDRLGPRYAGLREYWNDPTPQRRVALADAVTEVGFRGEFLNDPRAHLTEAVPPDLWRLHWSTMTPRRRRRHHRRAPRESCVIPPLPAWLREHQPPTLIVWGPRDRHMPEGAARAYLRDLPDAELHLFHDGGH